MSNALHWELVHEFLDYKGVQVTKGPSQSMVHLNEELDRKFMNRPFYWHYRDATNQAGEPMTISILKNDGSPTPPNSIIATPLNPIFKQLVEAAHLETRMFKGYETAESASSHYAPLYPWIIIQGLFTMDPPGAPSYWREAAVSLTTGSIKTGENLFDYKSLKGTLPDGHVTMSPIVQFERAIQKCLTELDSTGKTLFTNEIAEAKGLKDKMIPFLNQLKEKKDLREYEHLSALYEPKIRFDYPIGGLVYARNN
ncbi:YqhG family protein [Jeotgalibacillus sp. ET6]|uniref:YqhG family protein n=1 Tax=Jeotgalibacillus sp. ET6 TaxID=3037260 RepID=UPI002418B0A3|nr:YqhG family protein [Jeotgalibacillus sp. ET6]MDG5470787.1 YqhG family protein [Jeotgalibacillus sp. ET6]